MFIIKPIYVKVALVLLVIVITFFLIRANEKHIFKNEQISTRNYDSNNVEIKRDNYYLRNFMWSGIFPLYGGFIPDPHYLFQQPLDVTKYLHPIFQGQNVRYQLIQVNPYFQNKTSEMILGLEINSLPYEYRLEAPQDFHFFSSLSEPQSVFLYHENSLYYILQYNWEDNFLIYEIGSPFNENKNLSYKFVNIKEDAIPDFLDFAFPQDQIDSLLRHSYPIFHQFYSQYLNKDYSINLLKHKKDKAINLTAFYGARLNINRFKMKSINDEHFAQKVQNLYEFVTSVQNVELSNIPDVKKIVIEAEHKNYYDIVSLGESFQTSDFAIRSERKVVYIDDEYVDTLLNYIKQYKSLRDDKIQTIEYFEEKDEVKQSTPLLFEVITQYNDTEISIERKGISVLILPANLAPLVKKNSLNSTEYAFPNTDAIDDYFFVMDFRDFSLKFSYSEVQEMELFLQSIKNIKTPHS